MEESILKNVKKVIGLAEEYTAFDTDIILHINAAFATLNQLGVGPVNGFSIVDDSKKWSEYSIPLVQLELVKVYIPAKVRLAFDPPQTSFGIEAIKSQIGEFEWRLNFFREYALTDEEALP